MIIFGREDVAQVHIDGSEYPVQLRVQAPNKVIRGIGSAVNTLMMASMRATASTGAEIAKPYDIRDVQSLQVKTTAPEFSQAGNSSLTLSRAEALVSVDALSTTIAELYIQDLTSGMRGEDPRNSELVSAYSDLAQLIQPHLPG